ncbi:MAG: inositol-3-phosphate synthase, partial [Candidatus Thermoplasmatota archaeon]|nr:inositol-3-phosphate synthase [Candidatus Thermoplasmatota archaeon]
MVAIDSPANIEKASGRLGVLMPGLGAVSTTFIAGTIAIRKGISEPIGSLTQMGSLRLGKRTEKREVDIKDFVPLANLDDLVFGGWDIFKDNCYDAAVKAGVIEVSLLDQIKPELSSIKPMKAVFDKKFVKKLDGTHVKSIKGHRERIEALRQDMRAFKKENNVARMVMIWCGSTEVYQEPKGSVYESLDSFEKALDSDDSSIAPSVLYAYAAMMEGVPYANGAPNLSVDFPAMYSLASKEGIPIA